MRTILYVLLAAAGLAGLAVVLTQRGSRGANPSRQAERLLDRCRDMLSGIEDAARGFEGPQSATS